MCSVTFLFQFSGYVDVTLKCSLKLLILHVQNVHFWYKWFSMFSIVFKLNISLAIIIHLSRMQIILNYPLPMRSHMWEMPFIISLLIFRLSSPSHSMFIHLTLCVNS